MGSDPKTVQVLREAWETAVRTDRFGDALAALDGLELLEPDDARWPHRKGDLLRRLGKAVERCRQIDLRALLQWLGRSAAALCRRRPDDFHASDMSTTPPC